LAQTLFSAGVEVVSLHARGPFDALAFARLCRGLRAFRPRLLQTYLFHANLAGRLAAWLCGIERVVSGIRVAERRVWHLRLDRWTNSLVRVNVAVSRGVADYSVSAGGLSAGKVLVIPNGVDVQAFARARPASLPDLGVPVGARVLISVGRLDAQKGIDDLLVCAQEICSQFADVHWLIVGAGPMRSTLERRMARAGLNQRVHLLGWRADVPSLLRASYALVHAARWEGMPNVILEAMAAGLPVVSTNVEGAAELVDHGSTGLLVAAGAPAELARAAAQLLAAPAMARQWGAAGQSRVERDFRWETSVAAYQALYARLLADGNS